MNDNIHAKNSLECFAHKLKYMIEEDNMSKFIDIKTKELLSKEVNELFLWLQNHSNEEKEIYEKRMNESKINMSSILQTGLLNLLGMSNIPGMSSISGMSNIFSMFGFPNVLDTSNIQNVTNNENNEGPIIEDVD